jgi:hypothetical protein
MIIPVIITPFAITIRLTSWPAHRQVVVCDASNSWLTINGLPATLLSDHYGKQTPTA